MHADEYPFIRRSVAMRSARIAIHKGLKLTQKGD